MYMYIAHTFEKYISFPGLCCLGISKKKYLCDRSTKILWYKHKIKYLTIVSVYFIIHENIHKTHAQFWLHIQQLLKAIKSHKSTSIHIPHGSGSKSSKRLTWDLVVLLTAASWRACTGCGTQGRHPSAGCERKRQGPSPLHPHHSPPPHWHRRHRGRRRHLFTRSFSDYVWVSVAHFYVFLRHWLGWLVITVVDDYFLCFSIKQTPHVSVGRRLIQD